jgi:small subunit ribosomal protein S7e
MSESKIVKRGGQQPDALETQVSNELLNLTNSNVCPELKDLHIVAAKEIDIGNGKKAVILFVPFPQLRQFQKIHIQLVRELEKKLSNRHIMIVAQRTVLGDGYLRSRNTNGPRPRSRTLTAVHDSILDDLVYPSEVVGRRTRFRVDGSRQVRVFLSRKEQANVESKLKTFGAVYKKLTSKDVVFQFPVHGVNC